MYISLFALQLCLGSWMLCALNLALHNYSGAEEEVKLDSFTIILIPSPNVAVSITLEIT